jgi:hypothetical protein
MPSLPIRYYEEIDLGVSQAVPQNIRISIQGCGTPGDVKVMVHTITSFFPTN